MIIVGPPFLGRRREVVFKCLEYPFAVTLFEGHVEFKSVAVGTPVTRRPYRDVYRIVMRMSLWRAESCSSELRVVVE